jgi:hypothetical protein
MSCLGIIYNNQCIVEQEQCTAMFTQDYEHIPTRPNRTQYKAANIGKGIDANTAPNFPADNRRKINKKTSNK